MTDPNKPRVKSPEVIAFAEKAGVDLSTITMTQGGPITKNAVLRAALCDRYELSRDASNDMIEGAVHGVMMQQRKAEARLQAKLAEQERADTRGGIEDRTAFSPGAGASMSAARARAASRGPAFALNALADKVRAEADPQAFQPTTPAPTLFAAGDLPAFTASGVAPEALLNVPWEARHAMAAAPTQADAYNIQADCAENDDSSLEYGAHPGNADYSNRVAKWAADSISDEAMEAMFAATPMGARTVEYEKKAGLPSDGSR